MNSDESLSDVLWTISKLTVMIFINLSCIFSAVATVAVLANIVMFSTESIWLAIATAVSLTLACMSGKDWLVGVFSRLLFTQAELLEMDNKFRKVKQ
jgi:hypothetical protein